MSHIAIATVSGVLTRDPDFKTLPSGTELTELSVASERSRRLDNGEYETSTSFFNVKVFGRFAVTCNAKMRKGDHLCVQGRLEQSRWEAQDGTKRSKIEVIAQDIDCPTAFFRKADGSDTQARTENNGQQSLPAEASPATAQPSPNQGGPSTAADDGIPF